MNEPTRAAYPRLSLMMFLQLSIWGSWAVLIGGHMNDLAFTEFQISLVFGTTAFGAILSPLVAGWVADRFMPAQTFAAISHFAGGALMIIAYRQTSFGGMWLAILLHALLYMPTIALTNAIAFRHMGDSDKFGNIRVWGTVSWIAVNWGLSAYLRFWEARSDTPHVGDSLLLAGALSFVMGLYCLTLPNTPPSKEARNPYAFLEALSLMANRNFAVLLLVSFVVAIELPFYYNLTFLFLTEPGHGVGLAPSAANFAMSLGQVAEILLMLLLFPAIRYIGMRTTVFLGILAWPVRYIIFAIGPPSWLVVAAQSLHGICYAFFFVGGMVAVERLSPKDIRASSQGLLVFATNGVGMLVGHFVSGWVHGHFALADGGHDWARIFMVPIGVTVVAAAAFIMLFSEQRYRDDVAAREAAADG
ncbi:MFS transporter [Candidatus Poribacteria bacterium]|jgi:nucleoside transporter|nr:MFS transporter [Candidatus Poribacteria bacterium]MBT5533010.1 MFS transporter [Candidatus Poribacteria bacterium]MBT5711741.1 MFS transporter [Candidatus Poribacteria bacterium]MBT7101514.1 MFS transporter [Candidatus Poribacteria bacterium]MBT7809327.1 MFS transporter [Candidatus Poribacteria bacterium]